MTSSPIPSDSRKRIGRAGNPRPNQRRRSAFTLPEVMIGASLGSVVLLGVMSTFLMLGRTGMNAANYSVSETEIRRGIEEFAQDARMASNFRWNSETSVTLTVPNNYAANGNQVTYAYDSGAQTFFRRPGDTSSTADAMTLISSVSDLEFFRYNRINDPATTDAETKRVQVTLNVRRTGSTLVAANTTLVSSSFLLRNKIAN